MKLEVAKLNKEGSSGLNVENNILEFSCIKPIIVQPSEIQKIQLACILNIPKGYILNISTSSVLYEKAGEIFPALLTLDHSYNDKVVIPVRNSGRNPLNLMPGMVIAKGYFSKLEKVQTAEMQAVEISKPVKSKPQRKNPISFEVN